ncbi:carbohydrate esterase family 3 protein [Cadophora sp. DSE1049]|nr:carbohydrate esterase family 3 protein [Cadophora sp. DSE1049]
MRFISALVTVGLLASEIRGDEFIVPNQTTLWGDTVLPTHLSKRGLASNIQLRIMPLGASIVYGQGSTDRNGFRYGLRNKLVWGGNPVNMVGSRQSGLMADNDVEGWPGDIISVVADKAKLTYPQKPNIVLIHVGTNDMIQNNDVANAHVRLGKLIDDTFEAIPGVTIIASTLLPNAYDQDNVRIYNNNIPAMIRARQSAGKKVTYVDFSSSWFSMADIGDGTHATNQGYLKMAVVWYQGIEAVANAGWLSAPASGVNDIVIGGNTCWKIPGNAIGPVKTQQGSGYDDGPYRHTGIPVGGFVGFNNPTPVGFNNPFEVGVYWADINGDGIDDYVYVAANANLGFGVALSTGNGNLGAYLYYPFSGYCLRRGVRWADMTGDGRNDPCCLYPTGDLECWQNTPGGDARQPNFVHLGIVKKSEGYPQAQIRLADIDGDGRADYVCFSASGTEIWGWRNGAVDNLPPAYWYPMRGVASGLPSMEMSGWGFADLNGDKRDDLIWVDVNGKVLGLTPVWENMGSTHGGQSGPAVVDFGAFMGSGSADYSSITIDSKTSNVYVDRWRNDDSGGRMVKGDGVRYCDMTGSGKDDYLWILSTGEITLYGNEGNWGYWRQWGVIYNANRARREIHIADYDGDGKCDILLVDKGSGATIVIKNNFANDKFSWTNLGVVTESASCGEGYGYDRHDNGVQWHDLDGDGMILVLNLPLRLVNFTPRHRV